MLNELSGSERYLYGNLLLGFSIHDITVSVPIVLFILCLVCDVILCRDASYAILHIYL